MTTQTETAVTVGARITGRCVTNGTTHTGLVAEVIDPAGFFDTSRRFRIVTDEHYSNGRLITPTVWHVSTEALAPELTRTDADGTVWHATSDLGDRLTGYTAALAGDDITWRRQIRVFFPQYSRGDAIRDAVAAATLPHERVVRLPMEHWGAGDVTITTELVFPSTAWCMECGHDVRPDRYGRVSPYAVTITPAGTHRSYTVRNYSHTAAHDLAALERAEGNEATVGIDGCG